MNKEIKISISNKGEVSIINIKGDVTAMTGVRIEDGYQKVNKDGAKKYYSVLTRKATLIAAGSLF
jgi:hypothetical protein